MSITVVDAIARIRPEGMSETLGSMSLIQRGFALAIPAAVIGTTAALVKMGMDAQTQLSIVAGLTGSSAAQMRYYTSSLEQMGAKFGVTLDAAAKGLYFVVSAGFQGADAITVLTTAMQHAAATGVPLQDVSRGLVSAMNSYGASAKDATRYSDMLTTAITYGVQTTADFANNVSKAALMAASAHVPFEQLAAAEAALTEKGEPANRAFTELSFMISKIAVPSADAMAKSVAALGGSLDATKYSSADLMGKLLLLRYHTGLTEDQFLKLVGGTRSARGALGLLSDQGAAYDAILQQMGNDSGVTAAAFQIHTRTMQFAFDRVKAAISNAGYALVTMITPAALDFLGNIADQAGRLPDMFTAIGDVVGPVFSKLGDSVTKVDAPVTAFRDHVAGINTVAVTTQGYLSKLRDYLVTTFGPAWQQISTFIDQQLVPAFKRFVDFVTGTVLPALQKLWLWFSANVLPILIQLATIILNQIIPTIQGMVKTILTQLVPALEQLWQKIGPVLIPIFQLWGWWMEHITGPVINGLIHAVSAVVTAIGWIVTQIGNVLGWFGNLGDWLGNRLPAGFGGAGAAIRTFGGWIGWLFDKISGLIGHIGDLLGALGHLKDKLGGIGGGLTGWNPIPGQAGGGLASGLTLVGEQGPELAVFPANTRIYNAQDTRAIIGGGGGYASLPSAYGGGNIGGGVVNIHIGGTRVAQLLWPELVAALRHGGALRT